MPNLTHLLALGAGDPLPVDEPSDELASANYSIPLFWLTFFSAQDVVEWPCAGLNQSFAGLADDRVRAVARSGSRLDAIVRQQPGAREIASIWSAFMAGLTTDRVAIWPCEVAAMADSADAWLAELRSQLDCLDDPDGELFQNQFAWIFDAQSQAELALHLCGYGMSHEVPWPTEIPAQTTPVGATASSPRFAEWIRRLPALWQKPIAPELSKLRRIRPGSTLDLVQGEPLERRANVYLYDGGVFVSAPPDPEHPDRSAEISSVGWVRSKAHFAYWVDDEDVPNAVDEEFPQPNLKVLGLDEFSKAGVARAFVKYGATETITARYRSMRWVKPGEVAPFRVLEISPWPPTSSVPAVMFDSAHPFDHDLPFAVQWRIRRVGR